MYTIVETHEFKRKVSDHWNNEERLTFFEHLSNNPLDGDVIPNGGGLRKIRWQRKGTGKRGGVRVIYYNLLDNGMILVLDIYPKSNKENLSNQELNHLKGKKDE